MKVENNKYDGFHKWELEEAFKKVQNKEHWKNPIDSFCSPADTKLVASAIEFFTGTEATFTAAGINKLKVTALGYYLGPCN